MPCVKVICVLIVLCNLLSFLELTNAQNDVGDGQNIDAEYTQRTYAQDIAFTPVNSHALYLTVHLARNADIQKCVRVLQQIESFVNTIGHSNGQTKYTKISYGIGFGQALLHRILPTWQELGIEDFPLHYRSSPLGNLPNTGGDIFIHAKSEKHGDLYQLAMMILNNLPKGSVAKSEDVYGWASSDGRDLMGFRSGTSNPSGAKLRASIAINPFTNGSYALTQKWVDKLGVIYRVQESRQEQWMGCRKSDGKIISPMIPTSHISRMKSDGKYPVVRQAQSWGTLSHQSGRFFIAYAGSPEPFNWMLDQMVGHDLEFKSGTSTGSRGPVDDLFRMTTCQTGAYWYFPSLAQLDLIYAQGGTAEGFDEGSAEMGDKQTGSQVEDERADEPTSEQNNGENTDWRADEQAN